MANHIKHRVYENLAFHPYNIFLILMMAGISALFIGLTLAFFYTRFNQGLEPIRPPLIFLFNTLILISSSVAIYQAIQAYKLDSTKQYIRSLWLTLGMSIIFLLGQFYGWQELINQNIQLSSGNGAAYLYLLSAVHFLHVIAGIPFLVQFIVTSRKKMKEPVSVLIYFSDPAKKLKLRLLSMYWHFLDALWIFLIVVLFLMYLFN